MDSPRLACTVEALTYQISPRITIIDSLCINLFHDVTKFRDCPNASLRSSVSMSTAPMYLDVQDKTHAMIFIDG